MGINQSKDSEGSQGGGGVKGEGSQGCVVEPHLQCADSDIISGDYISKLVVNEDIADEYDKLLQFGLGEIDKENELFIIPFKKCDLPSTLDDKSYKECSKFKDISDEELVNKYTNLVQVNGGNTLEEYITGPVSIGSVLPNEYDDLLIFHFMNILIAAAVLNDMSISHRDIKPANITFNPDKSMRLIDFGLASKYTDNLFKEVGDWWVADYSYWPLDINVVSPEKNGNFNKIERIFKEDGGIDKTKKISILINEAAELYSKCSPWREDIARNKDYSWILNPEHETLMFQSLVRFMKDVHLNNIKPDKKDVNIELTLTREIQSKWDVFMIGASLAEFLSSPEHFKEAAAAARKEASDSLDTLEAEDDAGDVALEAASRILDEAKIAEEEADMKNDTKWESDSPDFMEGFNKLIMDMTSLHPFERPTIVEALVRLIKMTEEDQYIEVHENYPDEFAEIKEKISRLLPNIDME